MDKITKAQRSTLMSKVRSRGNDTTEEKLASILRKNKIWGWRRHDKKLPGTPDFSFGEKKIAVYVDGCFWHGCKKCYKAPKSNKSFWNKKLITNIERDKRNRKAVKKLGWEHVRIWEHEIRRSSDKVLERLLIKFEKHLNKP